MYNEWQYIGATFPQGSFINVPEQKSRAYIAYLFYGMVLFGSNAAAAAVSPLSLSHTLKSPCSRTFYV